MVFALIASCAIAALALVGILVFGNHPHTERLHRFILPVAVGVFLGVVFFELLPETLEANELGGGVAVLAGLLGFYLLSHFIDTYHHHHDDGEGDDCTRGGARKLLIGDAIHNLADGVVIASSFMINPVVGALTTIGIAFHEIPQEIVEYGVLRAASYSQKRALLLNLLSASSVIVGVLLTYALGATLGEYVYVLTGLAAGNLLYIATADLIPELRAAHRDHFPKMFIATLCGVLFIGSIILITHEKMEVHEAEHSELSPNLQ